MISTAIAMMLLVEALIVIIMLLVIIHSNQKTIMRLEAEILELKTAFKNCGYLMEHNDGYQFHWAENAAQEYAKEHKLKGVTITNLFQRQDK